LAAPTGDMIKPSGKIGQMRAHQNHAASAVLIAVFDLEALHGMVPQNAPACPLGEGQAGKNVTRFGEAHGQLPCRSRHNRQAEQEGGEPPTAV